MRTWASLAVAICLFFTAAPAVAAPTPTVWVEWAANTIVVGNISNAIGNVSPVLQGQRATVEAWTGTKWSTSQVSSTNAYGKFMLPLTYGANTVGPQRFRFTVTVDGKVYYSREWTLTRMASAINYQIVLLSANGKPYVGAPNMAIGRVTPAKAGLRVTSDVFLNDSYWSTSQVGTTDSTGTVRIPLTYGANQVGSTRYRLAVWFGTRHSVTDFFWVDRIATPKVTVSLLSAPSQVAVGAEATAQGRVSPGVSGQRVSVQAKVGSAWSTSQVGTTDANGGFRLPLSYGSNTPGAKQFRLAVAAYDQTFYSREFTTTRFVSVANPKVTLQSAPPFIGVLTSPMVSGRFTPAVAGVPVSIQALVGSAWSTSQVGTTDANGAFKLPLTFGANKVGDQKFRLTAAANGQTIHSQEFTIRRFVSPPTASVVLVSAPPVVSVGASPIASGRFTPAVAGVPVSIQALVGSAWSTSQVGTTDANGAFKLPLTFGANKAGAQKYRLTADANGQTILSQEFTITRV